MARFPKPFFRTPRKLWYVQIGKKQYNLGPDKEAAFNEYHRLMAAPPVEVDATLVVGVLDGFLTWGKGKRSARTCEFHQWYIQRFVDWLPEAATMRAAALRPHHVQAWIDSLGSVSDSHRHNAIQSVKRAFSWATEFGFVEKNPIASLRSPASGRREKVISPETYAKMLPHLRDAAFRDVAVFAWETGARPQEIRHLEARHFEPGLARFRLPKEEAKGKRKVRCIYLTETALEIATRLVALRPAGKLFRTRKGDAWDKEKIASRMQRLSAKIGERFVLYDFRHSFAHRMLVRGTDSLTVAELLGHSGVATLAKVYSHLDQGTSFLLEKLRAAST